MLVSGDIKGINEHIPLLYKERAETQELIDCLHTWYKQAELEGSADIGRIVQLLQIVRTEEQSIHQRIIALTNAADQLSAANKKIEEILGDEARKVKFLEGIL